MIAFGELTPGDKIGELIPGGGYMTRILSKAVGPAGKVYVFASAPRRVCRSNGSRRLRGLQPCAASISSLTTERDLPFASSPSAWVGV